MANRNAVVLITAVVLIGIAWLLWNSGGEPGGESYRSSHAKAFGDGEEYLATDHDGNANANAKANARTLKKVLITKKNHHSLSKSVGANGNKEGFNDAFDAKNSKQSKSSRKIANDQWRGESRTAVAVQPGDDDEYDEYEPDDEPTNFVEPGIETETYLGQVVPPGKSRQHKRVLK